MPTSHFSIKVTNYDGNPCNDVKIAVAGKGLDTTWLEEYTNSDGWAYFSFYFAIDGFLNAEVFINGDKAGEKLFYDGVTASFTIDW
jgi:hypothetical protein